MYLEIQTNGQVSESKLCHILLQILRELANAI